MKTVENGCDDISFITQYGGHIKAENQIKNTQVGLFNTVKRLKETTQYT